MKKIIILFLLVTINLQAQFTKQVEIYQDFKMLVYENEHQLTAPTLDVLVKLSVIEEKGKVNAGLGVTYERANLHNSTYNRLGLDLLKLQFKVFDKGNVGIDFNTGLTKRFKQYNISYQGDLYVDYQLNKRLSLSVLSCITTRPDIDRLRISNFIGIKYKI